VCQLSVNQPCQSSWTLGGVRKTGQHQLRRAGARFRLVQHQLTLQPPSAWLLVPWSCYQSLRHVAFQRLLMWHLWTGAECSSAATLGAVSLLLPTNNRRPTMWAQSTPRREEQSSVRLVCRLLVSGSRLTGQKCSGMRQTSWSCCPQRSSPSRSKAPSQCGLCYCPRACVGSKQCPNYIGCSYWGHQHHKKLTMYTLMYIPHHSLTEPYSTYRSTSSHLPNVLVGALLTIHTVTGALQLVAMLNPRKSSATPVTESKTPQIQQRFAHHMHAAALPSMELIVCSR
jgi:hypothetical protein